MPVVDRAGRTERLFPASQPLLALSQSLAAEQRRVLLKAYYVEVQYRVRSARRVKDILRARGRADHERTVNAVRGVSLTVREGDSIGLIGSNGAGKSSFLRAICGLEPTCGGQVVGTVRPRLLGVGAVLRPEWTGRETIEVGLRALGVDRSLRRTLARDIVDFVGLESAIDRPVATYSRGMRGRLLFAVSTAVPARILCVDESLGGADGRFKAAAERRLEQLLSRSGSLILVSHSMGTVRRLTRRTVWMEDGLVVRDGKTEEVTAEYEERMAVPDDPVDGDQA